MFRWIAGWVCGWVIVGTTAAAPITNGSFSTPGVPPDPFVSWTTTYGTIPTDGGGFLVLAEDGMSSQVQLQQTFDLPANAYSLEFVLRFTAPADPAGPGGSGPADGFQASLLDAGNNYLFPANAPAFPGYYGVDSTGFVQAGPGVGTAGSLVTLDVSAVAGTTVTLEFLLNLGDDGFLGRAEVDDVVVRVRPDRTVPEPGTLLVVGGLSVAVAAGRRRAAHG